MANNTCEKTKCLEHFYRPGDRVMIWRPKQFRKKTKESDGPYLISTLLHIETVNIDTVAAQQRLSICRISRANWNYFIWDIDISPIFFAFLHVY